MADRKSDGPTIRADISPDVARLAKAVFEITEALKLLADQMGETEPSSAVWGHALAANRQMFKLLYGDDYDDAVETAIDKALKNDASGENA